MWNGKSYDVEDYHVKEKLDPITKLPKVGKVFKTLAELEQQGHGTGTIALLAGGKVTNELTEKEYQGYFGAFPFAQVVTLKISESVVLLSGKRFAAALRYAVDVAKCDVVTMSMAGLPSREMLKAIDHAYENGVVVVSAGSNTWSDEEGGFKAKKFPKSILYPARLKRTIGVTGATVEHTPYLRSYQQHLNQGERAPGGDYMQTAFGPEDVMDTVMAAFSPNGRWAARTNGKDFFEKSGGGTSMATPQVAAAAALYIHKYRKELEEFRIPSKSH